MEGPAIIVEGEVYEFSPNRIRSETDPLFDKIDFKEKIGAITKIKPCGNKYIFTDENGVLWKTSFLGHLELVTDQYRVIDFAYVFDNEQRTYYVLTDANDLIVISRKYGIPGSPQSHIKITDTKFSKIFSHHDMAMFIDISGNLWCNSVLYRHDMFPALPKKGQLVYQVTERFKFIDCTLSHTHVCALDSDGILYIGGIRGFLPVDDNDDTPFLKLSKTDNSVRFRAVSAYNIQTAYIDIYDNLWMSGPADLCGINVMNTSKIPITKVLENVNSVSCVGSITCALLNDGTLLCTGKSSNTHGQWSRQTFEKVFDGHVDKLFNDKENTARYKKTKSAKDIKTWKDLR